MPKTGKESEFTIAAKKRSKFIAESVGWWQYVGVAIEKDWFGQHTEGGKMRAVLESNFEDLIWNYCLFEATK